MTVDWDDLKKVMHPIKDYAALRKRWRDVFAYPFVLETYNFSISEMGAYTQRLLGEDERNRYGEYTQTLVETFIQLHQANVLDVIDLFIRVDTTKHFEIFTADTGIDEREVISALKYLVYWFIPTKKYLSSLVKKDSPVFKTIKALKNVGIRTNLDVLQSGLTPEGREGIAGVSGLSVSEINLITNWADFSRMPWASKATISNIIGTGYGSIEELANADPEQLYRDFMDYGASIGKNLKFGNEIESSYRIAKIIPRILEK